MSAPRTENVSEGRFPAEPPPAHVVPLMGNTACAYATGTDPDRRARGVYVQRKQGWQMIAHLPHVLEVVQHVDSAGRWTSRSYRLSAGPVGDAKRVTLVATEDLPHVRWADALGMTLGHDPRVQQAVATALEVVARSAPVTTAVPTWDAGALALPSPDVGPAGYGTRALITEEDARRGWSALLAHGVDAPKLALLAGMALGGLYVRPLRRQSFVALLVGAAGQGKTTALTVGAALMGDPETVVRPWNVSPIGLSQEMGQLATLPAFRDEYGAAGLTPPKTEQMIFQVCQGASRTVGGKTGTPRTSGSWHGVLMATGNDSIAGSVANEGVTRRLVEVEVPITRDAETAEEIDALAAECHGWPLHWLRAAGVTPDEFAERIAGAEQELPLPDGAVPRSLGRHLALGVAGAELLARLVLDDADAGAAHPVRAAALDAARALLDQLTREARERGITPGQRVLSAVLAALASRPMAFPEREHYRAVLAGENQFATLNVREVEGWTLTRDLSVEGDLAVLSSRLDAICAEAGLTNPRTGLRELDKAGAGGRAGVLRAGDADGRLVRDLRVGPDGRRVSVYVFRLDEPPAPVSPVDPTGDVPAGTPTGDRPPAAGDGTSTSGNAGRGVLQAVPGSPGVSPVVPGSADRTGDSSNAGVTSGNTSSKGDLVPGVPGSAEEPHVREAGALDVDADVIDPDGVAGPVRRVAGAAPAPCRVCGGGPAPFRDALGAVHPFTCARVDVDDPAPVENGAQSAVETPAAPTAAISTPQADGAAQKAVQRPVGVPEPVGLAGVLDAAGLWLPGADRPLTTESGLCWPADAGQAYALAVEHRVWQLWVHPSAHPLLGIPTAAERAGGISPAAAEAHPWAESEHVTGDPAGGLAAWVNLTPTDPDSGGHRRALVFPAYESRAPWATATDGRELLAGVLALAGALGSVERRDARYYFSPNETSGAVLRANLPAIKHPRTDRWGPPVLELPDGTFTEGGTLPGVESFRMPRADWTRPGGLLDEEDMAGAWVHSYDRNGAQPAVFSGLHLARDPGDDAGPVFVGVDPARVTLSNVKTREGYYLVGIDAAALDTRLPALTGPRSHGEPDERGAVWVTGEWLTRLLELGAGVQVHRAVVARVAERWMRQFGKTFSDGRTALLEATCGHSRTCGCGSCVALGAFKAAFRSRVGAFAQRTESGRLYRPDVQHMIVTKAYANQHRAAEKIAEKSGRFPLAQYVDALYYVGDSPDPAACVPRGMKLGTTLREWKCEGSVPLAAIREHDGWETGLRAVFVKERESIGGAR